MTLAEAVLVAMMHLACPRDEPAEQCRPWRALVAEAIADAAERATCTSEWSEPRCDPVWHGAADELAALLVEVGYHESGFRRRIQAGQCRADECDAVRRGGRTVRHLARSMWQLHVSPRIPGYPGDVPREAWLACTGTEYEHVLTAAQAAARVLAHRPSAFGLTLGRGKRAREAWRILGWIRRAGK